MLVPIGFVVVMAMVFGGYVLAGGKFGVIMHALPFEGMMIMGASIGAFLVANKSTVLKTTLKTFGKIFKGPKWKKDDYKDILILLFTLTKTMRGKGMIELESHIEKPHESTIFAKYPKIQHDHFAVDFICDTLRMISMNLEDPHQVENHMERLLEKHHHEAGAGGHALQTVADGLPAIGIVAAVLGVIKTMSSITEPPEILGGMIGGALVGTFLGVFLAYCFVGPMSTKAVQTIDEEGHFYSIIRDTLVAHLHGNAPQVSVEIGRANVPSHLQPTFAELEQAFAEIKA